LSELKLSDVEMTPLVQVQEFEGGYKKRSVLIVARG
jgi:hypothetical protein